MKKIKLLFFSVLLLAVQTAFSQTRVCDLEITLSTDQPYNIASFGDTIQILINIKNNGPDAIIATDTIEILDLGFPFSSVFTDIDIAPGATITLDDARGWAHHSQTENDTTEFCKAILPSETFQNPINQNDTSCVTSILLGSNSVNINELRIDQVSLYPNPASETIVFDFEQLKEDVSIEIYDINGRLLNTYKTSKNQFEIDISHLSIGMYIVKMRMREGILTKKISVVK